MHNLLISAACLVFAVAFIAEIQSTGQRARTTALSRFVWILVGFVVSGALVLAAEKATSPGSHVGSDLATRSLETAADYLPNMLFVAVAITCADVFRVLRARSVADRHIAVPGRPRVPGADQPPAST